MEHEVLTSSEFSDQPTIVALAERIGALLKQKKLRFACAESCTGGYISHCITAVAGSSDYFEGAVVSYSNQVKERVLCVKSESLANFGAVSRQVAHEMVTGVRELLSVDAAVAVTGIAGPQGGTSEKPVGTVWIAAAFGEEVVVKQFHFRGDREQNIRCTANAALLLVAQLIEN